MNNRSPLFQSTAFYLSTLLIWLSIGLFSSSLLTAQEAYLLGDENNNQFSEIKHLQNDVYATGNITDNVGNTFGTFSKIDPATGMVIWTAQLDVPSSLHDFIIADEVFIAVGRTEPILNPDGGWLDNQSLVCKISMTGAILQTRIYDVDSDGGREGFSKIVYNNAPLDANYPFYIAGHVDADGFTMPNAIDDLVVMSIDFNLNPFVTRRYFGAAGNNTDDEWARVFIALNDGTGQMVLMGDEGNNNTVRAVAFYINNDGSVVVGSERHFHPSLEVIYDAILLPNRQFVIVGRNAQNTNFIMKTDAAFNPFWAAQIPEHQEFVKVIQHQEDYYTVMLERNSTNTTRYIVNRIKEGGTPLTPSLVWSKTLHDNDNSFSHPFIYSTGSQIIYGNSRVPDASGEIVSGYGLQDIMMAVTDQSLETCITQPVETQLITLSVEPQDYQVATITIDVPSNDVQEWHFIEYASMPVCEEACPSDCVTSSIIINTGYDHTTGTTYAPGSYDAFWTLVQSPDAGIWLPRPAYAVSPNAAWSNQASTAWISAYPFANFNQNNTPPATPYSFQFCFCVCEDNTDVTFDLSAYADNNVFVDLYDDTGGFVSDLVDITDTGTGAFQTPPETNTTTVTLNEGTYCIRADLHNLSSVAMGFNMMGTITGGSLIEPLCCSDANYITGFKFNDRNCDGQFSGNPNSEPLMSGWDIQVCDAMNNVVATATTDALGFYVIPNLPPGTYTVKEVNQPGWVQSYPAGGSHTVIIAAGQVVGDINFGNIKPEECNCINAFFTETNNPNNPDDCCFDLIIDTDVPDYYTGVRVTPMGGTFTAWNLDAGNWNYVGVPSPSGVWFQHNSGTIPAGAHNAINLCADNTPATILIEWMEGDLVICEEELTIVCSDEPCDDLMATFNPIGGNEDECCYAVDLQNFYGNNVTRFEATIMTPDVIFDSGTVFGGHTWDVSNTTSTNLSVNFGGGNLPMGNYPNAFEFCLANTGTSPVGATTIVYRWYEQVPGTDEVAICEKSVTLQCFMPPVTNCVELIDIRVECDENGNYVFKFKVVNNTALVADHVLFYNIAPAGFVFDDIYPSFPPLAPGNTSGDICLLITPNSPVLSPTNLCFDVALFGTSPNGDAYPCCFADDEVCITLDPCCDPCEGTSVDVQAIQVDPNQETCCWSMDLVNECEPSIFNKVEIEIATPGVIFGAHFIGGANPADWNNPVSSPTRIQWAHNSGTIPNGFIDDVINFCLDDIDDASEVPQVIVVKWITCDAMGVEEVICEDVVTLDCPVEQDYECVEITEDDIHCNEDNTYTYCFTVKNISTGMFDATHILLNPTSPSGITFSPDAFAAALPFGASVNICTTISSVNPLNPGDKITFEVRLANLTSDDHWCCFESEEHCVFIPECPDDCCDISPNEFHDWVNQGFTWNPSTDCYTGIATPIHNFDPDCDVITWVWGDGTSSASSTHTYTSNGVYSICMIVTRYDANGEICMQAEFCRTITIECPQDCCPINPNIFAEWVEEGFSWTNECADITAIPNHVFDEDCDVVRWVWGDGSAPTVSNGSNPVMHTYLNPGWYVICMEVIRYDANGEICAMHRMYQEVYVEDCECPCDESFYDDVNAGFTVTTGACRNRTITANNVGVNECDQVVWSVTRPGQPGIGFMGTSFTYNFPSNGIYEICMYVTRTNPVTGEVCEFVYCRRIRVRCVLQIDPWVVINTANIVNNYGFGTLINPLTSNINNRLMDWEVAMGTPETLAGSGCDDDNYAELAGNKTVVDGLQQLITMDADTYYELSYCYRFLTAQFGEPKPGTELVFRISKTAQATPDCVGDCDEIGRFSLPTNLADDWASADQTPYYSGDMSGSVYLTIHLENGVPDDGTDASKSFINIDNILLEKATDDCDGFDVTLTDEGFVQVGYPVVRAENDIFSDMVIGGDAVATYQAGNSINLTGGFEVQLGVDFIAEIAACTAQNLTENEADFRNDEEITTPQLEAVPSLHAYPNPFRQNTLIEYEVPTTGTVQISIFNMTGQLVTTLLPSQTKEVGQYQVTFEANDLSEGIYYVRMNAADKVLTQKIVLLK